VSSRQVQPLSDGGLFFQPSLGDSCLNGIRTARTKKPTLVNWQGLLQHKGKTAERTRSSEQMTVLTRFVSRRAIRCRALSVSLGVVRHDINAGLDALVADVHGWACDQLPHIVLGFITERATKPWLIMLLAGLLLCPTEHSLSRLSNVAVQALAKRSGASRLQPLVWR